MLIQRPTINRQVCFFFAAVIIALCCQPAIAQSVKRPITLDDLSRIRTVGDPQRSPDGKWVAYTVTSTDTEEDKDNSDIWMTSWDGAQHVRMTSSREDESCPRWSPDGRYLAFIASRGTEEEKKLGDQVWLLDRAGGEAQKLTEIKGGVAEYAWSPDSKRLVIVAGDRDPADDPEKMEGWKRKTEPPIVIDRYYFKQDRDGYLKRLYSHLWLFDVGAHKTDALTFGMFDDKSPSWSPDGREIAFVSKRGPDPDRTENTDIYIIEAKPGAEPRQLTTFPGSDSGHPAWSPDGKWIAYLQGDEPRFTAYSIDKLALIPAGGGAPKVLTEALDRDISEPILWAADGKSLLFLVADDRAVYVGRTPVVGGHVEKLTTGRRTVSEISLGHDGAVTLLTGTPTEIEEVHALEGNRLRRLTHQNDDLFTELQLGITEDFTSKSADGTIINGLMVKPASFTPGKLYPTLLDIHGGPYGQDDDSFSFDREFFAANGYVVLAMNYRGSSGRGSAFGKAIYADWGHKEVKDLLGAVDQAVAVGVADPERLGIGGWSYGGILTDYTIASDTRFKVAFSGAGSALQLSMYGSDEYINQYEREIGLPWKAMDLWIKVSYPFFHADNIKTPTLFMGGDKDFNVPIIGGEQMYQALKSLGIETQLVIYPGQCHILTIPSYIRDRLERSHAWYDKHLKGTH